MAMYLEHFGLARAPFAMHPDPDFLYLSDQHSSAKAFLESSAFVNDSFFVITGSIGAGKTTLVEGFLAELPTSTTVIARINQTQLSPTGFLRLLLDELGLEAFKAKKPQLLARLRKFLAKCSREGLKVVVVVDEAQNLETTVLEEIRMMTGNQEASCLTIVLVGQPEFLDTLESPQLRQLAQRCRLRSRLQPLEEPETIEYVRHRMAIAGADEETVFDDLTLLQIHALTGGIPRLINSLCDTALICAFADGLNIVDAEVLEAAIEELNWDARAANQSLRSQNRPDSGQTESLKTARENARQKRALTRRDQRIAELEAALAAAEAQSADQQQAAVAAQESTEDATDDVSVEPLPVDFGDALSSQHQRLEKLHQQLQSLLDDQTAQDDGELEAQSELLEEQQEALEQCLLETESLLESAGQASAENEDEQTAKYTALHEQLQDKDEQLKSLGKQLQGLEAAASELETRRAELKEKDQAVKVLEDTVSTLEAQLDEDGQLRTGLEERQLAAEQLESTVASLEQQLGEYQRQEAQLLELQSRHEDVERALNEAQARRTECDTALQAAEDTASQLREQVSEQAQQLEALKDARSELESREQRITALDAELAERSGEIDELHRQLEEQSRLRQEYERSGEQAAEEIAELNVAGQQSLVRVSELEAALQQTQDELQAAQSQVDMLSEQLAALPEIRKSLAARDTRIAELDQQVEALQDELSATSDERNAAMASIETLNKALQERDDMVAGFERKISGRDNSIVTLEAEVRRKNRLIDELHDKLEPLPAMEDQVAVLGRENSELCDEVESRNVRIFELQEALSLSRQRLDDARLEIDNSHNEHVGLHKQVGELQSQMSLLQEGNSLRDDLVTSLQTECQNRKLDLRKLRRQLDETLDQARELKDTAELGDNRVRELEVELAVAMETISEMSEAGSAASENASEIGSELEERAGEVAALQQALVENQEKLTAMEAVLKEKTETIKVLELDAEAPAEQPDSESGDPDPAQEQLVFQLRGEIEARDKRIVELESSLHNLSESLAAATEQLSIQSESMRELESQLESSRAAAAELREELGETDREFDRTAVIDDTSSELADTDSRPVAIDAGLLVSTNGSPTRKIPLRSNRLIIGRTRDSDIKIDNEYASRHHAQIVYEQGNFVLEDLNSTNGIFVNARRVKRRMLRDRDVISIGPDKLIFVREQHTSH